MCNTTVTPEGYMIVEDFTESGGKLIRIFDDKNRLVEYEDTEGNHFIYRFDNGAEIPSQFKNLNEENFWIDYVNTDEWDIAYD
jgi:hypothetical protein